MPSYDLILVGSRMLFLVIENGSLMFLDFLTLLGILVLGFFFLIWGLLTIHFGEAFLLK